MFEHLTRESTLTRFFAKVNKDGPIVREGLTPCHLYGKIKKNSYGLLHKPEINGVTLKYIGAHVFAYIITYGLVPEGKMVLHTCDNRPCVNPDHLFAGTAGDNMWDKVKKGRANAPLGEAHGLSLLTDEQILSIREEYAAGGVFQKDLAKKYGVTRMCIGAITLGTHWKHVGGPICQRRIIAGSRSRARQRAMQVLGTPISPLDGSKNT